MVEPEKHAHTHTHNMQQIVFPRQQWLGKSAPLLRLYINVSRLPGNLRQPLLSPVFLDTEKRIKHKG